MSGFDGIYEKLKRADENVINLKAEIDTFIKKGKYPVLPNPNNKRWQEAVDYHRDRIIPLRFSVLAGEIIHHLRSALDHIVWHFSSDDARRKFSNVIEFPVFKSRPADEKAISRYEGKIQGVRNAVVRQLIADAQPYTAGDNAASHPIAIIHDMDRFDKHRELTIVTSTAWVVFHIPGDMPELARKVMLYQQGKMPATDRPVVSRALKEYAQVTPQVSFRNFGGREIQSVIPALTQLTSHVRDVVLKFDGLH
ncbi:MAG TPA: hypothetical protein VFA74_00745 [Terriglobales bacterium]|nr:hypothetical protein [Terriglobales bacterium]